VPYLFGKESCVKGLEFPKTKTTEGFTLADVAFMETIDFPSFNFRSPPKSKDDRLDFITKGFR